MRTLALVAAIVMASVIETPAQTMPNLTYPEPGTFCGFLKPCDVQSAKTPVGE